MTTFTNLFIRCLQQFASASRISYKSFSFNIGSLGIYIRITCSNTRLKKVWLTRRSYGEHFNLSFANH